MHKHQGLAFELLDFGSEAYFVPDAKYQLLDSLINQVARQGQYDSQLSDEEQIVSQTRLIYKATSDTLAQNEFGLCITTDTFGDAP